LGYASMHAASLRYIHYPGAISPATMSLVACRSADLMRAMLAFGAWNCDWLRWRPQRDQDH
jgi:hypothetical protein